MKQFFSLKTLRNIFFGLAVLIVVFGAGFRLGAGNTDREAFVSTSKFITGKNPNKLTNLDFSLFWDVWDLLFRAYIDKKALKPEKMLYGAISGMVSSLEDPYTFFLPPEQNKEIKDDLGGKFEGIGAQLGVKDKKIVVIAPLKGSPAEKSGLKAEDWIVKVDEEDIANWTLPEAVSKIRGPKGSKVVLTVMHKDATKSSEVAIIRDEIQVPSVEWEIKNIKYQLRLNRSQISNNKYNTIKEQCGDCAKVVYLKLSRFGDNTTSEWNKAVDDIVETIKQSDKKTVKGLVFDLRNNPGGYLTGSVFIASEFLPKGVIVIQESSKGRRETYSVNRKGKLLDIPMVVLINKGSASASEIVAGSLKERGRAKLVGSTTFGKGSIQEAKDLSSGTGIHITTAKWLLPSGKWINGTGLEPDVSISNKDAPEGVDLQLEKAIESLLNIN